MGRMGSPGDIPGRRFNFVGSCAVRLYFDGSCLSFWVVGARVPRYLQEDPDSFSTCRPFRRRFGQDVRKRRPDGKCRAFEYFLEYL